MEFDTETRSIYEGTMVGLVQRNKVYFYEELEMRNKEDYSLKINMGLEVMTELINWIFDFFYMESIPLIRDNLDKIKNLCWSLASTHEKGLFLLVCFTCEKWKKH